MKQDRLTGRTISALCLWAVAGSLALVLSGRAVAGVFDEPVSPIIPVLATLITLALSLTAWTLFQSRDVPEYTGRRLLDGMLAVVPAGLVGFATSVNVTPIALASVSALLICGLAWVAAWEGTRQLTISHETTAAESTDFAPENSERAMLSEATSSAQKSVRIDSEHDGSAPARQQLTRRALAAGGEEIEAVLIARFDAGQRQTAIHLPIHPVLSNTPNVECEPLDDSSVTVRPTSVRGYGVRVEVKRTGAIDVAAEVPIGILVMSSQSGESAA